MAEKARAEPAGMPRKETTLASGTFSELPTIEQAKVFGPASPLGSDQFDFAQPSPLREPSAADAEAPDYLNGGHAHDRVSPHTIPDGGPSPPPLTADATSQPADAPEVAEPPSPAVGRKSVQFTPDDAIYEPSATHSRKDSWDTREALGKLRGSGFITKLKELAGPSGLQTPRSASLGPELPSTTSSPIASRQATRIPRDANEGSDDDADAEETADETAAGRSKGKQKRKRRMRRLRMESYSVPTTPQVSSLGPETPDAHSRLAFLRRPTLAGTDEHGFSEGEGRDRLTGQRGQRRGTDRMSRLAGEGEEIDHPSSLRVGHHFRRFSSLGVGGGGASDGDIMSPRRPFFGADRASTFGVQKWRQVKGALNLLRKKKDEQFDFSKSAELMAELFGGAPAVLMLASMIQRDEHGNKRIPVLLEQLRLRIVDSTPAEDKDSERHWLFTMELEYGSGPSQMKWTIQRTIKDILNLHWKYKLTLGNEGFPSKSSDHAARRPKQPKFPLSAFPYLRGVRGLDENEGEEPGNDARGEETAGEFTAGEGTVQEGTDMDERPPMPKKRSRMTYLAGRRKPSTLGSNADLTQVVADAAAQRRKYVERQQRMLEKYLQDMIRWLMFRADSNRLCRFLELSALGVRLAAEGSYHGKECYLHIQSSQGLDFRRVLTPGKVIARHSRKWFLVRQSYIVCVESPENMNIYDVYLVDSQFRIKSKTRNQHLHLIKSREHDEDIQSLDPSARRPAGKHHTLKLITSERNVKLFSPNQHLIGQFEESIMEMLKATPWHKENRFGSFAPVRTGVHAQWLVDGRDYMWNVSRAISMAKDVVYIHDWWLSPELYMRRPACISQKWRLDRLLQRKAAEGVKIFVIVYRNVEAAIPIDSEYTKFSLLNLHPNIFIQRSPHQFKKNQFFFAHHEKLCIVDHDIAFVGGLDLCFGRWDTPKHPVVDDKPTGFEPQDDPKDAEHCQLFPGKDYSNPRVQDFSKLHEPYEEMYDRSVTPRMPWHDIAMQVVGQPARDLTRHFVQRWNYVRRGRKPTRPTPFLLPPPDCKPEELEAMGLAGTCEVQILRSATTWSLGTEHTEHSIQQAYIKMIDNSDHFVYMENQFFITSTDTLNTRIVNGIGDALVHRIMRAHEKDEDWRAVIVMPLMPGFQNEVNEPDGSSVRLILQFQFHSICRGEHSIFGRLRAAGIEPEDYIQFFSLRQWGKLGNGVLTTEQLYIHAKCIIVDDRIALIGSANINERSMLGTRDSETAAIVRDTDMIWSTMAGRPYQVGRFAHTLRLRLMREHLGLDVDEILDEERQADLDREEQFRAEMEEIYDETPDRSPVAESSARRPYSFVEVPMTPTSPPPEPHSLNHEAITEEPRNRMRALSKSSKGPTSPAELPSHKRDVEGFGPDHWKTAQEEGLDYGRDSVIVNDREVLLRSIAAEGKGTLDSPSSPHKLRRPSGTSIPEEAGDHHEGMPPMPPFDRRTTEQAGLPRTNQLPTLPVVDDTDIGGPPVRVDSGGRAVDSASAILPIDIKLADIHKDCMRDPLNPTFYDDVWCRAAENNTRIYRRVFRCMPDSEVTSWTEYKEFISYKERFKKSMNCQRSSEDSNEKPHPHAAHAAPGAASQTSGGAGIGAPGPTAGLAAVTEKVGNVAKSAAAKTTSPLSSSSGDAAFDEKQAAATPDDGLLQPVATNPRDPEKQEQLHAAVDSSHDTTQTSTAATEPNGRLGARPDSSSRNKERRPTFSNQEKPPPPTGVSSSSNNHADGSAGAGVKPAGSQKRRRRATTGRGSRPRFGAADELLTRAEAEELLLLTQGPLVQFPYDWLVVEETNGNWLFQVDQVAPLAIYN
ncbi:phospholipase D [Parathielavia hyrcaniae]|uniref:Phospholipase D1 n=1 Tax=Parathielavia hyrcaniae TaxID=113614 RepID=A0AAN6Q2Z5_9PEZI|nr:phospholipase D [Parathielavia hyrcaniae]